MLRFSVTFLLILLINPFTACTTNTTVDTDTSRLGKLDTAALRTMIEARLAADSIPSVSIAVVADGKIIWEAGFGWADRENKIPATLHTPYYTASISKSITSTALMVLCERRLMQLDQPMNRYLKNAKLSGVQWDADMATVRRVATHTAGIPTFDYRCYSCNVHPANLYINRYGFIAWQPGTRFDYSNLDYGILSQSIADVSGQPFADFLKTQIFQPLGMLDASLNKNSKIKDLTAVSYSYQYGRRDNIVSVAEGASSVYASVHDLALFSLFHLKSPLPSQKMILSNGAIDTLHGPLVSTGFTGQAKQYGIGWWVGENRYGYHSIMAQGGTDYSSSMIQLYPAENIAIIGLSNKGSGILDPIFKTIFTMLVPAAKETDVQQVATAPKPPVSPAAVVGKWKGVIKTYKGEVSLSFVVDTAGTVKALSGTRTVLQLNKANFNASTQRLSVQLQTDLGLEEDTGGESYRSDFYLILRDNKLSGFLTTDPLASQQRFARLSYRVELTRGE